MLMSVKLIEVGVTLFLTLWFIYNMYFDEYLIFSVFLEANIKEIILLM